MNHIKKSRGFTIVELLLAMGFVSALLLAIAMTVIQIGNIYNKGVTFKNVNQIGGAIANELQNTLGSVPTFSLDADHYRVTPQGGRLCTERYSYIWNNGAYLDPVNNPALYPNRYTYSTATTSDIRLVKIYDPSHVYCTVANQQPSQAVSTEMIDAGQYNLAIQSLSVRTYVTATSGASGQQLYSIAFALGTNNQQALDLSISPIQCKPPGAAGADPAYCSVNQFNVLARAGSIAD